MISASVLTAAMKLFKKRVKSLTSLQKYAKWVTKPSTLTNVGSSCWKSLKPQNILYAEITSFYGFTCLQQKVTSDYYMIKSPKSYWFR